MKVSPTGRATSCDGSDRWSWSSSDCPLGDGLRLKSGLVSRAPICWLFVVELCWPSAPALVSVATDFAIELLDSGFADAAQALPATGWDALRLFSGCACVSSAPTVSAGRAPAALLVVPTVSAGLSPAALLAVLTVSAGRPSGFGSRGPGDDACCVGIIFASSVRGHGQP